MLVEVEAERSFLRSILPAESVQGDSDQHFKRRVAQTGKQRPTKLRVVESETESLKTAVNPAGKKHYSSLGEQWPGLQQQVLHEAVVTFEVAPGLPCGLNQGSAADSGQTPDALAEYQPRVLHTQNKMLYPSHFATDEEARVDPPSPIFQANQPGSQVPTRPAILTKVGYRDDRCLISHHILIHTVFHQFCFMKAFQADSIYNCLSLCIAVWLASFSKLSAWLV